MPVLPDPPSKILMGYFTQLGVFNDPVSFLPLYAPKRRSMPDAPDNVVCFYDTQAKQLARLMRGDTVRHFSIDVRIRSLDYDDGWRMGEALQTVSDKIINQKYLFINGNEYTIQSLYRKTDLTTMGEEPMKRREMFTLNYYAVISLSYVKNVVGVKQGLMISLFNGNDIKQGAIASYQNRIGSKQGSILIINTVNDLIDEDGLSIVDRDSIQLEGV